MLEISKHEKLETPIQSVHSFSGGPLDGKSFRATEHYRLLPEKTVIAINSANYVYKGGGKFEFLGMTHKTVFPEPTPLQKIKGKVLKFLLS